MNENCYIIDKTGQLRVFSGSNFQTVSYFPPYYRGEELLTLPHRNGITVKGNIAEILWQGQYPDPSGIWVYEEGNLYHRSALTKDGLGTLETESVVALHQGDDNYCSGGILGDNNDTLQGIFEKGAKTRTSVVTSKMTSSEINDIWQDIALKYDDGDFVIKKKAKATLVEGSGATTFEGTWTSATTFTTGTDFTDEVTAGNIAVGDEIIIRKGKCDGLLAHITDITGNIVTIDEGYGATSGKFKFSCENWDKLNLSKRDFITASLKDSRLEDLQLKIDARGDFEELQVQNITDKTIQKR
jgi:hypothetical protein